MEPDRYCTECGYGLTINDKFCPSCGAVVRDSHEFGEEPKEEGAVVSYASASEKRSSTLNKVMVLTFLWGVIAISSGAYMVTQCSAIADFLIDSAIDLPYEEIDRAALESTYTVIGTIVLLSGVFAAISGVFDYVRKQYTLSLVFMILSVVCACTGIITLIIGIIVALKLTKCKNEFES